MEGGEEGVQARRRLGAVDQSADQLRTRRRRPARSGGRSTRRGSCGLPARGLRRAARRRRRSAAGPPRCTRASSPCRRNPGRRGGGPEGRRPAAGWCLRRRSCPQVYTSVCGTIATRPAAGPADPRPAVPVPITAEGGSSERQAAQVPRGIGARRLPGAGRPHPRLLARQRHLPQEPLGAGPGRAALGLLRGPTHGERQARRPPRPLPHLQRHLPALQDDARLPRAPQGRLGLSRPAGRARGRATPRHRRQGADRGLRRRRVQPALPRERADLPARVGPDDRAHRFLDRLWTTPTTRSPTTTSSRYGGCCGASGTRACCIRASRSCTTARAAARPSRATRSRRATRTSRRTPSTRASP